ncbi:MAG: hypothetical protein HY049_10020 [Acidobacteria bacterium]|nr:hypothetical protein [Acidobacteriota bacterium]
MKTRSTPPRDGRTLEAAFLLLSLGALGPLVTVAFPWGHDTVAHLFRVAETARALGEGVLYPRFVPDAFGGLGGPILDFNPVLPYYLPALLVLLGAGPIVSLKIAAGGTVLAAAIAAAIFARPHAGRSGAAITGLAYVYLPYRIADVYVRMAYSELFAMAVLPLALASTRRAVRHPSARAIGTAAAVTSLIPASHFPSTVIGLPLVAAYALFSSRRGARARSVLAAAASLALALALAAFVWVPALADLPGTHYEEGAKGPDWYGDHFLEAPQLFSTAWGFGASVPGTADHMSFQMGWAHVALLLAAIAAAALTGRGRAAVGFAALLAVGGSTLTLSITRPLWDRLHVLQNVQFPWRFLMVVGLGTSLAAGMATFTIAASARGRLVVQIAVAALLVAACVPYLKARQGSGSDADFTREAMQAKYFGDPKFQPKEVERLHFLPEGPRAAIVDAAGDAMPGSAATIVAERTHGMTVQVDSPADATLRVHLFATPGWRADSDGVAARLRAEPGTALVLVDVPAGRHRVDLRFADTPARRGAWLLSAFAAAATAFALLRRRPEQS